MEKKIIRLEGDACYEITLRAADQKYKESTKLAGKTYSRFSFNGIIFNVNDSMGFREALAQQDLSTVKLVETTWERKTLGDDGKEIVTQEKGYEFDSFLRESDAFSRELRRAKHSATIATINRVAASEVLQPDALKALMEASI